MEQELQGWIHSLDPNDSVDLAQALVFAEAGRLGLPIADFQIPGRINIGDQGIDGRTKFPPTSSTRFPVGPCVWQIKSGASISGADEFNAKHVALHEAIRDGSDYVMFWTQSPTVPVLEAAKKEFEKIAAGYRSNVKVHFLESSAITQLMFPNLAVLQSRFRWFEGVVDLETWAEMFESRVSFKPDPNREGVIAEIRRHVQDSSARCELHIVGDVGVGKSQTLLEALRPIGLNQRVIVAPDGTRFDGDALLTQVASRKDSHLIFVADNCDNESRQSLTKLANLSSGRVRLITVGALPMRGGQLLGPYQIVKRLEVEAAKEIAQQFGLNDQEANLVANFTEGYPGLALMVARDFHGSGATPSIGDLVRRHPDIHANLETFFPDEDTRTALGVLALFEKVGFEEGVSFEKELVCEAFGIDVEVFNRAIESETGSLVAKRGRYRYVTPPLVAAWLVQGYVERNEDIIVGALSALPQTLIDALSTQFSHIAENAGVAGVVTKILSQPPFSSGALADVDAGAARFIHVASTVVPEKTLEVLERLLNGADNATIQTYVAGRREFVWALEVLSWDGEVFDRVADLLLKLVLNENETFANNSTGVLQGLFRVHLGGTTAPYLKRIEWAERAHTHGSEDADRNLVLALGLAFSFFESRMVSNPGWRLDPEDWKPSSNEEDIEVRMAAWKLLARWAGESEVLADLVAPVMAAALIQLSRADLVGRALDDVEGIEWSVIARRHFFEQASTLLRTNAVDGDTRMRLTSLLDTWKSGDFWARLEMIASMSRWRLADERTPDGSGFQVPTPIVEVANELVVRPIGEIVKAARQTLAGDQETIGLIFEEVSRQLGDSELLSLLADVVPIPVSAVLGAFGGRRDQMSDSEIDDLLESWIGGPYRDLIVRAMLLVPATDERVRILERAVAAGSNAKNISILYLGNWCSTISQGALNVILKILVESGGELEVNHGLGILGGWMDNHAAAVIEDDLKATGLRLLKAAPEFSGSDPMVPFHFAKVVSRLDLNADVQVSLVLNMLESGGVHPGSETLEELDRLVKIAPTAVLRQFFEVISSTDPNVRMRCRWLESHKLVTRVATVSGGDVLLSEVRTRLSKDQMSELGDHISFADALPASWLVELFEMASDDFGSHATHNFIYPTGGWNGSESNMLRTSRSRAQSWLDAVGTDSKMSSWLAEIVQMLDRQIALAEKREAERGW